MATQETSRDPVSVHQDAPDRPGEDRVRADAAPQLDSWTAGRARLVAFKADRLLTEAQRELGAFGEATLSADLAPDLLEVSERVGEALAVLERFQQRLRAREPHAPEVS